MLRLRRTWPGASPSPWREPGLSSSSTGRGMNLLERIVASKQQELAARQAARPLSELQAAVRDLPRPRNFYTAVSRRSPDGLHLIGEIKKASPSAGLIREDFDPVAIARI